MAGVLGELLPLSMAIALNPIPIIALMLMFQSPEAPRLSAAFTAGWVGGIVGSVLVAALLSSLVPDRDPDTSSPIMGVILLALGCGLLYAAYRQWTGRAADDEESPLPSWMESMTTMRPSRGLGVGLLISGLNFKHLLIAGSAGVIISASDLSTRAMVVAFLLFILFASSSALLLVLAHRALGAEFESRSAGLYQWLIRNNATILVVLLLVIGFVIIADGIAAF